MLCFFFFQAEDGIRDIGMTGVQTCALPILQLDQDEEVRVVTDHRGGATISQPNRPDGTVALPERVLGDLISEEMRRLDPDEPYSDALGAATGLHGLSERPAEREHVWLDPAEEDGDAAPREAAS